MPPASWQETVLRSPPQEPLRGEQSGGVTAGKGKRKGAEWAC